MSEKSGICRCIIILTLGGRYGGHQPADSASLPEMPHSFKGKYLGSNTSKIKGQYRAEKFGLVGGWTTRTLYCRDSALRQYRLSMLRQSAFEYLIDQIRKLHLSHLEFSLTMK